MREHVLPSCQQGKQNSEQAMGGDSSCQATHQAVKDPGNLWAFQLNYHTAGLAVTQNSKKKIFTPKNPISPSIQWLAILRTQKHTTAVLQVQTPPLEGCWGFLGSFKWQNCLDRGPPTQDVGASSKWLGLFFLFFLGGGSQSLTKKIRFLVVTGIFWETGRSNKSVFMFQFSIEILIDS